LWGLGWAPFRGHGPRGQACCAIPRSYKLFEFENALAHGICFLSLLGLLCLKAFPLGMCFLGLCGRLGLEGVLLRGKLPLLLVCVLLLLGLLCPHAGKLGLSL
jgi:hypothetical protein